MERFNFWAKRLFGRLGFMFASYWIRWIKKNLLVKDQIKRIASQKMREHFIDNWPNIKDPKNLVKLLDAYEAIKRP